YTVSWREPFLLDSMWSLALSGYFYDRIYNEYTEQRLGFRATLGRRISDYWQISGTLRGEKVGVQNIAFGPPPEITDFAGQHFLIGGRGTVSRDTRDSFLRPTSGNHLELSAEQVGGDYAFPILSGEDDQYFTLYQRPDASGKWVLALRSQV